MSVIRIPTVIKLVKYSGRRYTELCNLYGADSYGSDGKTYKIGLLSMSRIDDLKKENNTFRMINHKLKQNVMTDIFD